MNTLSAHPPDLRPFHLEWDFKMIIELCGVMARDNADVMKGKSGTTTFLCYTGNCLGIGLPQCLTVFFKCN